MLHAWHMAQVSIFMVSMSLMKKKNSKFTNIAKPIRAKVPTEKRMDNQLTKLLRWMGCTVGKDDSREIGILMGKLSDILGLVEKPTIEAKGQPEMLKAYHIVKEKADAVAMERSIPGGKKRAMYLPEFKDSLELLLTKDGLIILRNALSAGALAADLAAAPVAAAAPVTAALSNQENELAAAPVAAAPVAASPFAAAPAAAALSNHRRVRHMCLRVRHFPLAGWFPLGVFHLAVLLGTS